ncbi:MAG: hypothetical protein ACRD1Z_12810 [Vicinamibacteria bacterium]
MKKKSGVAAQLRIRELTRGGVFVADLPELERLVNQVYHESAIRDVIVPLMDTVERLGCALMEVLSGWHEEDLASRLSGEGTGRMRSFKAVTAGDVRRWRAALDKEPKKKP